MIAAVVGLALATAILIAVPGPSVIYLIGVALAQGRASALRGVLGNAVGTLTVGVIVALGLGAILSRYAVAVDVLRLVGAVVLAVIGWSYVRRARSAADEGAHAADEPLKRRAGRGPFSVGVLVGFTNPKALVIFGAIVPSFLPAGAGGTIVQVQLLALSLVPVLLGVMIDSVWVECAHRARAWLTRSASAIRRISAVGGALMLVMAAFLLVEAISGFVASLQP